MRLGFEYFAPCPRGTESLLADELRALKCRSVRPLTAGVSFGGPLSTGYRALLWSRLASRILLTLARVPAETADELYEAVRAMPWEDHVRPDGTISVDATGVNDGLRNTQFTGVRVKDAVADRFIASHGIRPSVNTSDPDVRINVVIRQNKATISIDLSGETLHRRGYREPGVQTEAPMKETLAAAMLAAAGWTDIFSAGGAFIDPLCGSGTLAIEAALMAGDIAPGLTRRRWGFTRWLGNDADLWADLVDEAADRREAGLTKLVPILASDADARAVDIARSCVRRAGLDGHVQLDVRELVDVTSPTDAAADADGAEAPASVPGLVAINPPYGERLQARAGIGVLYAQLADKLRAEFDGWTLAVITPDESIAGALGWEPVSTTEAYNGRILSPIRVFRVAEERVVAAAPATIGGVPGGIPYGVAMVVPNMHDVASQPAPAASAAGQPASAAPATPAAPYVAPPLILEPAAEVFANRLRKMAKHTEKWARKAGVGCYRVYDADLPDYAVAIDVYNGAGPNEGDRWVHVSEYAAPATIDPDRAERRLDDVLAVVPSILDVEPRDVFLKTRQRQRGTTQYTRVSRHGVVGIVAEAGLLFEVNFSDYLDTGLFLDHRMTRGWIGELAKDTRFLNLFAYTGTASVHAAAGGARETTTVDLSATYLAWAERNMVRNGFGGSAHRRLQFDVLQWIEAAGGNPNDRYDLIFCDPPTFSNSKRMNDTWDVQRDHVPLIMRTAQLLTPGGTLVFSCNRRKFQLDTEALAEAKLVCRDVTARTIPRDFESRPGVHVCWTIRRAEDV